MGHLLYLIGNVSKSNFREYEKQSKNMGKGSFAYAWVLDSTNEEVFYNILQRRRGVTTDIALRSFETKDRIITILDAPGHKDYVSNMISGTSQAHAAILVVSASTDEFESGISSQGQTQEHAILARSLGIKQLIVAVNKLDTVLYSESRYEEVVKVVKGYLKEWGFKESFVKYIYFI